MTDSVNLETHRRALIIEHAQVLYGAQYPQLPRYSESQRWSVILAKTREGRYKAHVVVYEQPGSLQTWKVLKSGGKTRMELSALDSLLDELRVEIGAKCFGE